MSHTSKKKKHRRTSIAVSSTLSSCIHQTINRFTNLFSHTKTTYKNSKLILGVMSSTVDKATLRYLLKLFILRIFLLVLTVMLNIGLSYPMNWYSTALNERNETDFWYYLTVFVLIVCITAPIFASDSYIHNLMAMRFRETLTNVLFDLYMSHRAYYHFRWKTSIDNPGQRFGDDIKQFAYGIFDLLNVILKHCLNLLGFSYVLYTIDISSVPMLIIYSVCGTIFALTVFSERLTNLGYILMKDQAEFIANIIRINDSSESIALYNAAKHERNWLQIRLKRLISDGIINCKWKAGLELFSHMFHFLSIVVPYVLLAKQYFKKEIEFGQLSQSIYAFSALLKALNIIINNIPTITSLSATSSRVGIAINTVYDIHKEHIENNNNNNMSDIIDDDLLEEKTQLINNSNSNKIITYETNNNNILKLENISYFAPKSDYLLLDKLNLILNSNESLLIVGFSGCGKSSLLRVISGLWNYGTGTIIRPKLNNCLFLPQKPYIPSLPLQCNTLRNQLLFPKYMNDNIINDIEILNVLEKINLTHLDTYCDRQNTKSLLYAKADWGNCMSIGEQQRLAIGRALIFEPNVCFVDEATSALDEINEQLMYKQLKNMNIPLISIGHHKDLAKFHDKVLQFQKNGKWKIWNSNEFLNL